MPSSRRQFKVSERTIGRLSIYRRLMLMLLEEGRATIFSHEIATAAGVTPAQVRRDFMEIGYTGSPSRGYELRKLTQSIGEFLDAPDPQRVGLVGIGNLGRAILAYFTGRRPKLSIVAAFDVHPERIGRVIHGCRCYDAANLVQSVRDLDIGIGVIATPAGAAQETADQLIQGGVGGILNFAPVSLRVPPHVHVEDMDMTMALERVAFFARSNMVRK